MRTATSLPLVAVITATATIAVAMPWASASTPASRAPAAKPTSRQGFDRAYRELSAARKDYDAVLGDPRRAPDLVHAAARLDAARRSIRSIVPAT